jgi:putative cofactor-binding repeat protein
MANYPGTPNNDTYTGTSGMDTINGAGGDDRLTGGGGNDRINGGNDLDTAVYAGNADAVTITSDGLGEFTVTSGTEGTDRLTTVEVLEHDGSQRTLLVGEGGGFATKDLVINKAVTIKGNQAGNAGADGSRDAAGGDGETTIIGHADITSAGAVTIDGVRFLNDNTTSPAGLANPTLDIMTGGHTVTNTIFYSTVPGGDDGNPSGTARDDAAMVVRPAASGTTTISNNLATGSSQGAFDTASWGRFVFFDGGGAYLSATGNTIENTRTGFNLDMSGDSAALIEGNSFKTSGTSIAVGIDNDNVTIRDNDFQNAGNEFNFRNLTTDVAFDAEIAVDAITDRRTGCGREPRSGDHEQQFCGRDGDWRPALRPKIHGSDQHRWQHFC